MARGNQEQMEYIKAVRTGVDDAKQGYPAWAKMEKKNGTYEIVEDFTWVEGEIIGIEYREYQYEGKTKRAFAIDMLESNGIKIRIGINLNIWSRSIINSLSSQEILSGKMVRLTIYRNKKDFVGVLVEVNGVKSEWKYSYDILPKPKEIDVGGGEIVKNYSEVDAAFKRLIENDLVPKLGNSSPPVEKIKEEIPSELGKSIRSDEFKTPEGFGDGYKDISPVAPVLEEDNDPDDLPF